MASKKSGSPSGTAQMRLPNFKESSVYRLRRPPLKEIATRNFFAPLRASYMDTDPANTEDTPREAAALAETGRPPPIVLTSAVSLILLQKQLKSVVSENFEFRRTRNGTRVITRSMADFQSVKSHFDSQNLSCYPFPKSEKPIKAVIHHLPHNTPAEDISEGLLSLGSDVITVKQMTATRRSPPEESKIINLPLFLMTLPRATKSQEIFHLPSLCHIAIRVEAYRTQNALTQCHNCQQFGHVWENGKKTPRCFWCGGGHLHKECPEKGNTYSTPTCFNCRLAKGEKPIPQIIGAADTRRRRCRKRSRRGYPGLQRGG
jgi:hypothetical protein